MLGALVARADLTAEQATWAMGEILAGEATPAQIAGFAVSLRAKGETVEEITGLVAAMYEKATPIEVPGRLLDVVGTGGDRSMSVNISTMAAIVAAGAGARVVKHGNRSASSQSGSADVLEALGIRLDLPPERVAALADEAGITFCFAAAFNPAMRHTAVPRRELGIGTTFNFLGPLANPTRPAGERRRLRRRPDGAGDGRRLRGPRRRRLGVPRRRRARRAHHHDHLVGLGRLRRRGHAPPPSTRRPTGSRRPPPSSCAAATPPTTPTSYAACSTAEPGPVRDAVLLNAGAALAVYDAPRRAGRRGPRPGDRQGAARPSTPARRGDAGALGRGQRRLVGSSIQPGGGWSISRSSLWCTTVQPSATRRL